MTTASEQLTILGKKEKDLQAKYVSLINDQQTIKQKIDYYEKVIRDGLPTDATPFEQNIFNQANQELSGLNSQLTQNQQDQVTAKQEWNAAQREVSAFIQNSQQTLADEQKEQLSQKNAEKAADPTSTVKSPENTNESQSDKASEQKQQNAAIVGNTSADSEWGDLEGAQKFQQEAPQREAANELDRESRRGNAGGLGTRGVPPGAEPRRVKAAIAQFKDSRGNIKGVDLRVKIRVPAEYIVSPGITNSTPLEDLGGIVFPYTPNISYSHNAEYTTQVPLHSNYSLNFYKNSTISRINISGKFTVQNDKDAEIYIAVVQLLRALVKMRSGGRKVDPFSGSPPPVCRLDAYGDYMMTNVPVSIAEFKMEVSDGVDYYTFGKLGFTDNISSVPTVSTISVVCVPMYSRAEMQKFAVTNWLDSYLKMRKEGYL